MAAPVPAAFSTEQRQESLTSTGPFIQAVSFKVGKSCRDSGLNVFLATLPQIYRLKLTLHSITNLCLEI